MTTRTRTDGSHFVDGGASENNTRSRRRHDDARTSVPSSRQLWRRKRNDDDEMCTTTDDGHNHTMNNPSLSAIKDLEERYLMRPEPKTFWEISNNAIVVAQEFSLSCYFLLRYRLFLLEEQEEEELLAQNRANNNYQTFLLQARQQQRQSYIDVSTLAMSFALMLVVYFGSQSYHQQQQSRKHKARQRLSDALLLAVLLRLLAGVLRTLTASYASDTVTSLVHYGMIVHLLFCDYDYANGKTVSTMTSAAAATNSYHQLQYHRRPPFQGGTLSLNAAFFATVVGISRLESNMTAYLLCSLAVIIFAFYPASRHAISVQCQEQATADGEGASWFVGAIRLYAHWIISAVILVAVVGLILALEAVPLEETTGATITVQSSTSTITSSEGYALLASFGGIWLSLVLVLPAWKAFVLQKYKKVMRPGCPWDIPTAASMQLHHDSQSN